MYTSELMGDMEYAPIMVRDDKDVFFQDIRELETLTKNSLLVYVAYELKALDAAAYLADTKLEFPLLQKEAELRKVKIEDLCKLILGKAKAYKDAIRIAELLRLEFSLTYPTLTTYEAKVELRDRLLKEFREATQGIW